METKHYKMVGSQQVELTNEEYKEGERKREKERLKREKEFDELRKKREYECSPLGQIEILRKEAKQKLEKAQNIENLLMKFPDLNRFVGRWEKEVFCSRSVNSIVDKYDRRYNCGCCEDSPLEIWPYIETEYGKVYSYPACFRVGERSGFSSSRPYDNWKERLEKENISENIIKKIESFFEYEKESEEHDSDFED